MAPKGPAGVRRSPSPMVSAATGPDAKEQQGSSQLATKQPDGRTATPTLVWASGSVSHARTEMLHGWRTLAMAIVLLRYRPPLTATTTGSSASRRSSPLLVALEAFPTRDTTIGANGPGRPRARCSYRAGGCLAIAPEF
ncbi:hypothetical protein D1007_22821 [Hordeum vulgare]|nr:hypothetical protein D1007_22821 [Hordeum vulgare]